MPAEKVNIKRKSYRCMYHNHNLNVAKISVSISCAKENAGKL